MDIIDSYMNDICKKIGGEKGSNYIDYTFQNQNKTIYKCEIENLYKKYVILDTEIDDFVSKNEIDKYGFKLEKHFENKIGSFYIEHDSLVNFVDFVEYYLNYNNFKELLIDKLTDFEIIHKLFDISNEDKARADIEEDLSKIEYVKAYSKYYDCLTTRNFNQNHKVEKDLQDIKYLFEDLENYYINIDKI